MLKLFPRVILANKATELHLSGDELKGRTKVTVSVQSMEKYNVPHTDKYRIDEDNRLIALDIDVNGGEAKFNFTPFGEQRHRVYIDTGVKKEVIEIYSLEEDLYKLTPFKGDTHLHTTESDGLFTPIETVAAYYEAGFDYMAITDHHKYAGSAKMAATMDKIAKHFKVYPGEEVHNRGMGYFHIINFGASASVNEIINADPDGVFEKITQNAAEIKKQYTLPDSIDEKEFAFRLWVSQKIREFGGLSVLCHPYWDAYGEYNMQTPMLEFLLENGIYDAFEVVDDDDHTGNGVNLQTAIYNEMRADGIKVPIIGASDCHSVVSESFDKFFTYAFCESVDGVKQAVKDLKTVAVERIGNEYRVYGPFRLVKYARFLCDNLEPKIKAVRKGTASRIAEAIESKNADLMAKTEVASQEYKQAFFGC